MRLIDADKLIASLKPEESVWVGLVLAEQVANAETVEAIPIERIVKRINYYSDLILKYPNEKELLYSQTELISLLEDWEKENEID